MEKIVSIREIQRNYRKLINQTKRTKQPIFLGKHYKPEAVLLDYNHYKLIEREPFRSKKNWAEIKKTLDWIRKGGKKNANLAKFIHEDRQRH